MTAPTHFYLASQIRDGFNTFRDGKRTGLGTGKSEDFCGSGREGRV